MLIFVKKWKKLKFKNLTQFMNMISYAIKKAIGAILYHCSNSSDGCEASRHLYCPKGADSWCKWQVDQTTGLQT